MLVDRYLGYLADMLATRSGHRTDSPMENGGWIYQRRNGSTFFRRAEQWRRKSGMINLKNPPNIKGARVIAVAHTHPYSEKDQENINREGFRNSRPSQNDVDTANGNFDISQATGIPDLVAFENNPKGIYDSRLKPGQIWVEVRGIGPDIPCGGSK
jgi:hypothetical protein